MIPSSETHQTVERAVADLRRGAMVVLHLGSGRAAVVQPAEMLAPGDIQALSRLSGTTPILALTGRRMMALVGVATEADRVRSIALPPDVNEEGVLVLADPTRRETPPEISSLAVIAEPEDGPAAAAVRLAKLARLLPAVLLAVIDHEGITSLRRWATAHGLLIVEAAAVSVYLAHRSANLVRILQVPVPLEDAENAEILAYRPPDGGDEHLAILIGPPDPAQPVLTRIHSQCLTGDLLGSLRCDCGPQLRNAIRRIAEDGSGLVVYLAQEGRDIGLVNKLRAYRLQDKGFDTIDANESLGFDADERAYLPAAAILRDLGISSIRLLTNNPNKIDSLAASGITVVERVPLVMSANPHNDRYLQTKALKAGHLF